MIAEHNTLPSPLSEVAGLYSDEIQKDIAVLAAITSISCCFPRYTGQYDGETINANLYSFISAPPASGKGAMKYGLELIAPIHKKKKKGIGPSKGKKGTPPVPKILIAPGNTSSAALLNLLSENRQGIILAETEADTVGNMFGKDFANYGDILRKGAHHERVSKARSTDNQYIEIEFPRISLLLTGTYNQISNTIHNTHDGLYTRFLFYSVSQPAKWRSVRSNKSINKKTIIKPLADKLFEIWDDARKRDMTFELSDSQWDIIDQNGELWTEDARPYGENAIGIAFRHGLMLYRVAMVLAILRHYEDGLADDVVEIWSEDLNQAIEIVNNSFYTSLEIFAKLNKLNFQINLNAGCKQFYEALPDEFDYGHEPTKVANSLSISKRSKNRYLKKIKEVELIVPSKTKKGIWHKKRNSSIT